MIPMQALSQSIIFMHCISALRLFQQNQGAWTHLLRALVSDHINKARQTVKKLSAEADLSRTAHYLRREHPELLHFNNSSKHPLWLNTPHSVGSHSRWLTATVGAACDDHRDKYRHVSMCRLCYLSPDTRVHLVLECKHAECRKTTTGTVRRDQENLSGSWVAHSYSLSL